MENDFEKLPELPDLLPEAPENELYEKHVFSDEPLKPSEQPEALTPEPLPAEEMEAETIAFDAPTVLDEHFAARKSAAPAQPPEPIAPRERRPARRPAEPRRTPLRSAAKQSHAPARSVSRLCSGETPSDAARRIIREFCALLVFVLLVCCGFWIKNTVADFLTDNSYSSLYQSTVYSDTVQCGGVSLEPATLPDGYAAAQAVCAQLGKPITDRSLFVKGTDQTVFASEVAQCMKSVLSEDAVQLRSGLSNRELLIQIHESLRANKPVIVLLSETGADGMALQYAVVTGMNAERDIITVVNPNSGSAQYSFEDFLAATRFKNFKNPPFPVRLGLTFGSLSRNTAIFVE